MTVDISDYSRNAAQRGWGPGWPSCSGAAGNLAVVTADLSGSKFSVHRRVAVMVDTLIDWTEKNGYLGKPAQCGAFNCRPIAGTKVPSQHSWGLACDWNWLENPYISGTQHTMPEWMPRKWNRYGWAWGGDYKGGKFDWMHLEFMGTPADADAMTALVLAELAGGAPAVSDWSSLPTLQQGSRGVAVAHLQDFCNRYGWRPPLPLLTIDGDYGSKTTSVIRSAQGQLGVTGPDAIGTPFGPRTKQAFWRIGFRG